MWIVVGMANNQMTAAGMKDALEAEGVLVKLRQTSASAKNNVIEVLVLESETDLAREVLLEKGL